MCEGVGEGISVIVYVREFVCDDGVVVWPVDWSCNLLVMCVLLSGWMDSCTFRYNERSHGRGDVFDRTRSLGNGRQYCKTYTRIDVMLTCIYVSKESEWTNNVFDDLPQLILLYRYDCIEFSVIISKNILCTVDLKRGMTPLHLAVFHEHTDIAHALLKAGAAGTLHQQDQVSCLSLYYLMAFICAGRTVWLTHSR